MAESNLKEPMDPNWDSRHNQGMQVSQNKQMNKNIPEDTAATSTQDYIKPLEGLESIEGKLRNRVYQDINAIYIHTHLKEEKKFFVSPNGEIFVCASNGICSLRDQNSYVIEDVKKATNFVFSSSAKQPKGTYKAFISASGKIYKYSYPKLKKKKKIKVSEKELICLKLSDNNEWLYAGNDSLYKVNTKTLEFTVVISSSINAFAVYQEKIAVCYNNIIQLIDEKTVETIENCDFTAIAYHEELIAAAKEKTIEIFEGKKKTKSISWIENILHLDFAQKNQELVAKTFSLGLVFWHLTESNFKPKVVGGKNIDLVIGAEDYSIAYLKSDHFIYKYKIQPWTNDKYISRESNIIGIVCLHEHFITYTEDKINLYSFQDKLYYKNNQMDIKKIFFSEKESSIFILCKCENTIQRMTIPEMEVIKTFSSGDFKIKDFIFINDDNQVIITDKEEIKLIESLNSVNDLIINHNLKNKILYQSMQLVNENLYILLNNEMLMKVNSKTYKLEFLEYFSKIVVFRISPDEEIILKFGQFHHHHQRKNRFSIFHTSKNSEIKYEDNCPNIEDFVFTKNNKFFLIVNEEVSSFQLWSRETLQKIAIIKYADHIKSVSLGMDDKMMIINEGGNPYLAASPFANKEFQVYGPSENEYTSYCIYLCKIFNLFKSPHHHIIVEYDKEFNDYIVTPDLYNVLHFFAWNLLFDQYNNALKHSSFHNTLTEISPLSFLIIKDEAKEVINTLKFLSKKTYKNAYAFGSLTQRTLIGLNNRGYPGLQDFYSHIIMDGRDYNLPKYCSKSIQLPIVVYNSEPEPISNIFMPNDSHLKDGIPITFFYSLIPVNMIQGSDESLRLVKSIIECKNIEIYNTPFIQLLLRDKWKGVKSYMVAMSLIYIAYLYLLLLYIINFADQIQSPTTATNSKLTFGKYSLILGFALNTLMIIYEIAQMIVHRIEYFKDYWNIVDLTRSLLYTTVAVIVFFCDRNQYAGWYFTLAEIFLVLISWIRGLTYFRIFDTTRYLTALVLEVIEGISSFMILTVYSVIGLSLMLFCSLESEAKDDFYFSFLGFTYMATLGEYSSFDQDVSNFHYTGIIIFTIASVVNTIVMMNLLISIIGDTYDRVQQSIAVADLRQLGAMVYEIESLMSWNRDVKERKFMKRVTRKYEGLDKQDVWTGKIREIKTTIIEGYKKLEEKIDHTDKTIKVLAKDIASIKEMLKPINS